MRTVRTQRRRRREGAPQGEGVSSHMRLSDAPSPDALLELFVDVGHAVRRAVSGIDARSCAGAPTATVSTRSTSSPTPRRAGSCNARRFGS